MAGQSIFVTIGAGLTGNFGSSFTKADASVSRLTSNVLKLDKQMGSLVKQSERVATIFKTVTAGVNMYEKAMAKATSIQGTAVTGTQNLTRSANSLATAYKNAAAARRSLNTASMATSPALVPTTRTSGTRRSGGAGAVSLGMLGSSLYGAGMSSLITGGFMAYGLEKMIKPAAEYQHQLAQMNVMGMKHLEIVQATKAAWDATKTVPTASVMENMAAVRELRMVFGNTSHAIENMPQVQRMQGVLEALLGTGAGDQAYTVAKALELKGAVRTPGEFNVQSDMMTKALVAAGGKVNASDFLGAFKYGRIATAGWSDKFAYTILPTLIQEMKGGGMTAGIGGPGSALMSAYAEVVGGVISKSSVQIANRLGLVDKGVLKPENFTKKGQLANVRGVGLMGQEVFQRDPFEWAQRFVLPALLRSGYKTPEQQKAIIQALFPSRTAGFAMNQLITQAWKFQRDQRLIQQASGISAYDQLLKSDPRLAKLALMKQWESLLARLGYEIMPTLLKWTEQLLPKINGWVDSIGELTRVHPDLIKNLTLGVIGLTGLTLAAGGIMLPLGMAIKTLKALGTVAKWVGGLSLVRSVLPGAAAAGGAGAGAAAGAGAGAGTAAGLTVVGGLAAGAVAAGSLIAFKSWMDKKTKDAFKSSLYGGEAAPINKVKTEIFNLEKTLREYEQSRMRTSLMFDPTKDKYDLSIQAEIAAKKQRLGELQKTYHTPTGPFDDVSLFRVAPSSPIGRPYGALANGMLPTTVSGQLSLSPWANLDERNVTGANIPISPDTQKSFEADKERLKELSRMKLVTPTIDIGGITIQLTPQMIRDGIASSVGVEVEKQLTPILEELDIGHDDQAAADTRSGLHDIVSP